MEKLHEKTEKTSQLEVDYLRNNWKIRNISIFTQTTLTPAADARRGLFFGQVLYSWYSTFRKEVCKMSTVPKTSVVAFPSPRHQMYRISAYGMAILNAMNVVWSLRCLLSRSPYFPIFFLWTLIFLVVSSWKVLKSENAYYYAFQHIPLRTIIKEICAMVFLVFLIAMVGMFLFLLPAGTHAVGSIFYA